MKKFKNKLDIDSIRKIIIMLVLDVISIVGSFFLALWVRHDFKMDDIPEEKLTVFMETVFIWAAIAVIVFAIFKLYNRIWSYVSVDELFRVLSAYGILIVVGALYFNLSGMREVMWLS